MNRSTRALRIGPALFLVLAITTAWAEPAPAPVAAQPVPAAAPVAVPPAAAAALAAEEASPSWFGWLDEPLPDRTLWRPAPPEPVVVEAPKAVAKAKPEKPKPDPAPAPKVIRNHFWIPKLGMSYHVYLFECTRSRPPDNYIYRWGCAGTNNVYILGHAYGVMKPLHDLYVRGGLRVGMVAKYADRKGVVHTYRVTEWRVVDPVESAWAIASQPRPSMTLQTCVGKDGRYRLNVRLVEV
jgi:sortase (surface protein transpeptidase)